MRPSVLLLIAFAVSGVAAFAAAALVVASPEPGHMLLHIGCRHHNHGPRWHADHGRMLGAARSTDDLADRALTAGRRRATPPPSLAD